MPTASVGAPPVRDRIVLSPTFVAASFSMSGVTAKPQLEIAAAAVSGVVPMTAGGAVHREVEARFERRRRDQRHDRDEALHQHRAVADEAGVDSRCRASSASCPTRRARGSPRPRRRRW